MSSASEGLSLQDRARMHRVLEDVADQASALQFEGRHFVLSEVRRALEDYRSAVAAAKVVLDDIFGSV